MKVKKVIKRIVALGTGFSMLGATMFGALAADLTNFPSPFVKDAKFDAKIVIGEAAATTDVIGAIDIANKLQYSMTKEGTVQGGAEVSMTGDSVKVAKSTNKLELNEMMDNIMKKITSSDLKTLADGSIDNDFGTHKYTQTIDVPKAQAKYALDPDNYWTAVDETPAEYLVFPSTSIAYEYKISFSPHLKSDHHAAGASYLNDVKGKKITILGKEYKILKADHDAANQISLTLMAGAQTDLLEEGATKTYTVEGKDYEVTASTITTSEVQFVVNNELTSTLTEGDTYKLTDGTEIGVSDIMENEAGEAAGGDKVEFSIGAQKIVIDDDSTSTNTYDADVTIGSEDLSNVKADIVTSSDGGTAAGADVKISDIKIRYNASAAVYIPKGKGLSEVADKLEGEAGNVFLSGFDIVFEGFEKPVTEEIKLSPSGTTAYKLTWKNANGQEYSTEVFALGGDNTVQLGVYSGGLKPMHIWENASIAQNEYFIISRGGYSHIMKFTNFNTNKNETKIKDMASGGKTYEISMTSKQGGTQGDLNLDGYTFKINTTTNGATLWADNDGDEAIAQGVIADGIASDQRTNDCTGTASGSYGLVTQYGACLSFIYRGVAGENATIKLTTEKLEGGASGSSQYNTTAIGLVYDSTDGIEIHNISTTGTFNWDFGGSGTGLQIGDENNYETYDGYGTKGYFQKPTSGQNTFTWTYPDSQVTAAVFFKSGMTTSSASSGVKTAEIVRIDVGSSVLDTDPSVLGKETTQNIIAVGGPAINRAAAVLLGKTYPAYGADSGIPENAAIIKLVENGANVGMVVAGWTAADTQRASRVLANNDKYVNFKGKEVKVTGTSLTDMVVNTVS